MEVNVERERRGGRRTWTRPSLHPDVTTSPARDESPGRRGWGHEPPRQMHSKLTKTPDVGVMSVVVPDASVNTHLPYGTGRDGTVNLGVVGTGLPGRVGDLRPSSLQDETRLSTVVVTSGLQQDVFCLGCTSLCPVLGRRVGGHTRSGVWSRVGPDGSPTDPRSPRFRHGPPCLGRVWAPLPPRPRRVDPCFLVSGHSRPGGPSPADTKTGVPEGVGVPVGVHSLRYHLRSDTRLGRGPSRRDSDTQSHTQTHSHTRTQTDTDTHKHAKTYRHRHT